MRGKMYYCIAAQVRWNNFVSILDFAQKDLVLRLLIVGRVLADRVAIWHHICTHYSIKVEVKMSISEGMTIIDNALGLAMSHLEGCGMPKDEAQIALLIRLRSVVPIEVANIADILRDDPEVLAAINKTKDVEHPVSNTV